MESAQLVRERLSHARIGTTHVGLSGRGTDHARRILDSRRARNCTHEARPPRVPGATRRQSVGRLAYVVDNGARILPFNYVVAEDSVILRTVPDGEIYHHALNSVCAFEVDETDEFFEAGWSVVVVGRLELATEEHFARMLYGKMPEPWAGGNRYLFVRLLCEQVSGRRVIGHSR